MVESSGSPLFPKAFRLTPLAAAGRFFRESPPETVAWDPLEPTRSPVTAHEKILEVLDSIRPAIQADGGDVELLSYREDEGLVEVRLLGACESCPISMLTLKEGIERRLKSSVPGVLEVNAV